MYPRQVWQSICINKDTAMAVSATNCPDCFDPFEVKPVMTRLRFIGVALIAIVIAMSQTTVRLQAQEPAAGVANLHKTLGLSCQDCHGEGEKKPVGMSKCLSCHESYAKVAERTKKLEPNPHDNHLIDLSCTKCHLGHKPKVIYCRNCHEDMEFKKP